MQGSIEYEVAGGVLVDGDRMLLLRDSRTGEIRLPKGHLEQGESHEEAAIREVAEETGYRPVGEVTCLGRMLNEFASNGGHIRRWETYYLMQVDGASRLAPRATDRARFKALWLPVDEAAKSLTFESEREFARRALEGP